MAGRSVLIIGAGFSGLATAALLAKKGFSVKVLEKNDQPGGRAMIFKKEGFLFDMGPSWYLTPDIFENYFQELGKKPSDYYKLIRLDPSYRVFFGHTERMDVRADLKSNMELFESLEKNAGNRMRQYLQLSEYQYRAAMKDFMYREYRSITDLLQKRLIREGWKFHLLESFHRYVSRFFKDERIQKILEYIVVFLGGTPFNTPALYSLMSHVDFNLGVWYPDGGLNRVVEALYSACREHHVVFEFNQHVRKINVKGKSACSVHTDQKEYTADIIVVNADYHHAETELLQSAHRSYNERYWAKRVMSPSAFVIYLGLAKKIPALCHHNLFLSSAWNDHFASIVQKPSWPQEPSFYIGCPSRTDKSVAPEGCENVFILVPVAAGLDDPDETREKYSEHILTLLEKTLNEKIRDAIRVKRIFSHRDYINLYHSYQGSAFGLAHTLFQTALFRPSYQSKKVKNLFYTGQYTHPGIGMPMTLISAQILCRKLEKQYAG